MIFENLYDPKQIHEWFPLENLTQVAQYNILQPHLGWFPWDKNQDGGGLTPVHVSHWVLKLGSQVMTFFKNAPNLRLPKKT